MQQQIDFDCVSEIESDCDSVDCPDCQLGATVEILGTPHHITFVQVRDCELVKNGQGLPLYEGQEPVGLARWYDNLVRADEGGNFQTVKVPGYKGDYVCMITPFHK